VSDGIETIGLAHCWAVLQQRRSMGLLLAYSKAEEPGRAKRAAGLLGRKENSIFPFRSSF